VSIEVWEKLAALDRLPCEVRLFSYRVIHNAYERNRYQKKSARIG
jgi:hypothetical protein